VGDETVSRLGRSWSIVALFSVAAPSAALAALSGDLGQCTYEYKLWNTKQQKVVDVIRVDKPRSELTALEVGPYGCTPCVEDQKAVRLQNGLTVVLCHKIADKVRDALNGALEGGALIESVGGYRAAMTRGPLDENGNRTELTYHAYGVALDINPGRNGMYENCYSWGPQCKLYKGGHWAPDTRGGLRDGGPVVTALEAIGLRWGGRMRGRLKDFMHFSPLGY
jgi:hypothetical protein